MVLKYFIFWSQINLCGGGTSSRAAEDVGSIVVQAARDRCAGTANSCPGRGEQSPYVVEYKTVVRINLPQATLQRQGSAQYWSFIPSSKYRRYRRTQKLLLLNLTLKKRKKNPRRESLFLKKDASLGLALELIHWELFNDLFFINIVINVINIINPVPKSFWWMVIINWKFFFL